MAYEGPKQQLLQGRAAFAAATNDKPLRGTGALPVGQMLATIVGVDTTMLERGKVTFSLEAGPELFTRVSMWVFTRNKPEQFTADIINIQKAIFGIRQYVDWFDIDNITLKESFELLRGMKLGIVVDKTEGYTLAWTATGYQLLTSEGKDGGEYDTIGDATDYAISQGWQRSRTIVTGYYSTAAAHKNFTALCTAIQTLTGTTSTSATSG